MLFLSFLWSSSKILITSLPVIALFFMSWFAGIPNKSINALHPIWHISFIVQQTIYMKMSLAYTPSKILFMIFSLTERVIYSMIYWKYTNKDKQREYLTTGKFSTLFTNVIPYGVLNFLIAFSFFVFYTQKFSWGKTDNALFYSGLMMSGFSCFLALYKGLELFFNSPRSTNLNAIIFADVFCFLGLSLMNYSYGTYLSLLIPFLNYFALRKSLGRSLSTKENDFLPVRDIVLPANVG